MLVIIRKSRDNIKEFHEKQKQGTWTYEDDEGNEHKLLYSDSHKIRGMREFLFFQQMNGNHILQCDMHKIDTDDYELFICGTNLQYDSSYGGPGMTMPIHPSPHPSPQHASCMVHAPAASLYKSKASMFKKTIKWDVSLFPIL